MRLSDADLLENREKWLAAGVKLPGFDRNQIKKNTNENPKWIHFGAGNIFRAFIADCCQQLIECGEEDVGIIVAEGWDYEIIDKSYRPFDDLALKITLNSDGSIEKKLIASITKSLHFDPENTQDFEDIKNIFRNPSLQIASFTITEKGYQFKLPDGSLHRNAERDFRNGPGDPVSYIGKIAAASYERYLNGKLPIAFMTLDNSSKNGEILENAIKIYAEKWVQNGKVDPDFLKYLNDDILVSFPWTMIDKITPRPNPRVFEILKKDGFNDMEIYVTKKNTHSAAFVNTEEVEYLVIEDNFPNGRPRLEKAGCILTDRETVDKAEKMKVGTCLNPLQTALAVFGCLLGYTDISEEMKDKDILNLLNKMAYLEMLPVVSDPKVISPDFFIDEVMKKRLTNSYLLDTPQRISSDTSRKMRARFGETILTYERLEADSARNLVYIPFVIAGWCRYLLAVDDSGKEMLVSTDPLYDELYMCVEHIQTDDKRRSASEIREILENTEIFGVNLYKIGLGEKIEKYFVNMIQGRGAVRRAISNL